MSAKPDDRNGVENARKPAPSPAAAKPVDPDDTPTLSESDLAALDPNDSACATKENLAALAETAKREAKKNAQLSQQFRSVASGGSPPKSGTFKFKRKS